IEVVHATQAVLEPDTQSKSTQSSGINSELVEPPTWNTPLFSPGLQSIFCLLGPAFPSAPVIRGQDNLKLGVESTLTCQVAISLSQSGLYQCMAENSQGKDVADVLVTVHAPPTNTSISVSPADEVVEGQTVAISSPDIPKKGATTGWTVPATPSGPGPPGPGKLQL
uniref:Ig-like domain-containing protein n=1 Tax=Echeneis naucrates TaxID=173247 RepID=A0A665U473_ECHNA